MGKCEGITNHLVLTIAVSLVWIVFNGIYFKVTFRSLVQYHLEKWTETDVFFLGVLKLSGMWADMNVGSFHQGKGYPLNEG